MKRVITFFALITTVFSLLNGQTERSKYVWINNSGTERFVNAYFRYNFTLEEVTDIADIQIFADSRYKLYVNNTFVNYGPARFYPENPEYDSYDISTYLKKGNNCIAVHVVSNGMNTYQLVQNQGGFIAWGKIEASGKSLNLQTPGNWKSARSQGYKESTPKFSFAQAPFEVYDANKGIHNWKTIDFDDSDWKKPVVLENQNAWGALKKRSIDHLQHRKYVPEHLMDAFEVEDDERTYSFQIKTPDQTTQEYWESPRLFAYTYIYSPQKQSIDAGLWWGEHFLNGEGPLPYQELKKGINNRHDISLDLKKGWNFFFVKYDVMFSSWDFYMALPKSANLILSPQKKKDPVNDFMTMGPFKDDEKTIVQNLDLPPKSPDDLPKEIKTQWVPRKTSDWTGNPSYEIAWSQFGDQINIHKSKVSDITIDKEKDVTLMFDMGFNSHGRLFIDYEAPRGTIVNLGWEEDATYGRPNILKRPGLFTAAQHIAKEGENYFETFKPYGHRYIQLLIQNANGPVTINKIGRIEQVYPLEKKGWFKCSDPMMNSIWDLGWRTIRICAEDVFLDPFRERGLYAGDLMAQTTLSYVTSGDLSLVRKSMREIQGLYGEVMRDFPDVQYDRHGIGLLGDYPLITLMNLRWYYDLSKDTAFIKESYPAYKTMMDSLYEKRNEKGIIGHYTGFIEWIQIEKKADLAPVHALIARAYSDLSFLSNVLKKKQQAKKYADISQEVSNTVKEKFWDKKKGAFFDGYKNGEKIESWFPASSAWPVIYNTTTNEQDQQISRFLEKELKEIGKINRKSKTTPYGGQYIIGALYKLNRADVAEKFIRKYWSYMILQGDDTAWENFYLDPHESKSHGWSGSPTYYMSTKTLGVQLGWPEPTDLSKITIAPQSASLSWAQGVVPHPLGNVYVEWEIKGEKLFLNYDAPENAEVIVKPAGRLAELKLIVNTIDQ